MAIKIKQNAKLKKQIKKTAKKKSGSSVKRDINLSIPYRNNISIARKKNKRKVNKNFVRKIIMLLLVVCLAFSSVPNSKNSAFKVIHSIN